MSIPENWTERCRGLARQDPPALRCGMTHRGRSGHVGSMLSMAELLAVLYTRDARASIPRSPASPDRDRFILSKGHGGGAVYAVLAELGFFPSEWLEDLLSR